jgi:hypothetical protein
LARAFLYAYYRRWGANDEEKIEMEIVGEEELELIYLSNPFDTPISSEI